MWSYLFREADRERGFADATQAQQDHQPTTILQHPLLKCDQFRLASIKRCDIDCLPPICPTKKRGSLGNSVLVPAQVALRLCLARLLEQIIKPNLIKNTFPTC